MNVDEAVPASEDSAHMSCESIRQQLITLCQQIITDASTCEDEAALQGSLKHMKAAYATLQAATRNKPKSIPVARKVLSNKTTETQHQFHSTEIKRKSVTKRLHKPSADEVTCANMQNGHVGEPAVTGLGNNVQGDNAAQRFTYDNVVFVVCADGYSPSETVSNVPTNTVSVKCETS